MKRHFDVKTDPGKTVIKHGTKSEMPVIHEVGERRGMWAPFEEMERWMEETMHRPFLFDFSLRPLGRLFHEMSGWSEVTPSVDMFTEGNELVVKAELAGMKREDINVRLVDNHLTISGEKKSAEKIERKDYLRLERSYGSFSRTVHLPEGVMTDKATASFRDGVLEVRMPREAKGEGKTITIK